jgi:hypothetical protein
MKGWAASQKAMEYNMLGEGGETNHMLTITSSELTGDMCDDIDDTPITYDL